MCLALPGRGRREEARIPATDRSSAGDNRDIDCSGGVAGSVRAPEEGGREARRDN